MPSFATPAQLASHLHTAVDTASAQQALDGASGLLRTAAKLTADPSPVPVDLRTWTLELAAMIYENPAGRQTEGAGDNSATWGLRRRAEILEEAAAAYGPPAPSPRLSVGTIRLSPWSTP